MKKKIASLLLTSALAVSSLAGCGNGSDSAKAQGSKAAESTTETAQETSDDDGSLQRVLDAGELLVGTEGTYAPFSYHDDSNKLVGYDVEVAEALAEKLGVKATFVETEWDSMIAGLESARFDIISNQVGITDERKEKFDFTEPDSYAQGAIIIKKGNSDIKDTSDLEGKKAAHTLTSNWAAVSEGFGAELVGVDGFEQAVELITFGRADFTINDNIAFYDYLKQKPDAEIEIAKLLDDISVSGIPVRKADQSLYNALNEALKELIADGTLSKISEKYFGIDISQPQ